MTTRETRLAQIDALRREALARLERQDDSAAAVAATALALVEKLTGMVHELGETVAVLCWAARRLGLNLEAARMEMLIGLARSQAAPGRTAGPDGDREEFA